jgi:hypothetical protein
MTKARILADFISDGSSLADGTISVAEVSGAAPLASPTFTGTVVADGLTVDGTGGQITTDNNGFITSKQSLDVATAGGRFIGKSNRGELGHMAIEQTANGADGGYIRFDTSPSGSTSPTERMRIESTGGLITTPAAGGQAVFNEAGVDADFRVESDGNTHMLFVDAGNDQVVVGDSGNYYSKFTVVGSKTISGNGPLNQLSVYDNSAMAANTGGAITLWGNYTTDGTQTEGASIEAVKANGTNANYQYGIWLKSRTHGGAMDSRLYMDQAQTIFNESGFDTDFRVESDTNAHMLFVDAGNNRVGVNMSNPAAPFHVAGGTSDTIAAANAIAKITANGLDGLAIGAIASAPYSAYLQSGYTANGYSPAYNNGYPLALNPLNGNVVIGATNVAASTDGLSVVGSSKDNISLMYTGTTGGHTSSIDFRDKRFVANARINNFLVDDGVGTAGAHLDFSTAVSGTLSNRLRLGGPSQTEAVFNDPGYDYDFRVESDTNTHALFVDAGYNAVGIANAAPRAPLDIRSTIGAHALVAGFIRATSNDAVNILTVSGQPSNCGVAIYARLVAASAVTNEAAVIEFWAALTKQNYGADNATAVAPVVSKAIVGTAIGAGSLAWSGKTLQYTPACSVNYVGYQMEIQVVTNDSATITINAVI